MNSFTASDLATINPYSQREIDLAKSIHPGQGVGVAVSNELVALIVAGAITDAKQLPSEYRHLAKVTGLPH